MESKGLIWIVAGVLLLCLCVSGVSALVDSYSVHIVSTGQGYDTIQQAIDAANAEDIINVDGRAGDGEGSYAPFIVNKLLTIRGIDRGDGDPVVKLPEYTSGHAVEFGSEADGSHLEKMTIEETVELGGSGPMGTGIYLAPGSSTITLSDLTVNNFATGIEVNAAKNNQINKVTAYGNRIAIWLDAQSASNTIDNCDLTNGYDTYWPGYSTGVRIWGSSNNIIQNSYIAGMNSGISLINYQGYASSGNIIRVNILENNDDKLDEYYERTSGMAIALNAASNDIYSNRIYNNFVGIGIYDNGVNNKIYNNDFGQHANTVIEGPSGPSVPNIWSNALSGSNIIGRDTPIAGNYWSDPPTGGYSWDCADATNDGICDSPYTIDSLSSNIDSYPLTDYASFGYGYDNCNYVNFYGNSKGNPTTWDWDFGDGTEHSNEAYYTSHTYATKEFHVVKLTISYADKSPFVITRTITPPTGSLSITSVPDHALINFGESPLVGGETPLTISCVEDGRYWARASFDGYWDQDAEINVQNGAPASYEFDLIPAGTIAATATTDPQIVQFTYTPSADPVTNFQWDFGDMTDFSTDQNPVHTYTAPGPYTVYLNGWSYPEGRTTLYTTFTKEITVPLGTNPDVRPVIPTGEEAVTTAVTKVLLGIVTPDTSLQVGNNWVKSQDCVPLLDGSKVCNPLPKSAWVIVIDDAKNDQLFHKVCYVFVNDENFYSAEICTMSPPADATAFAWSNQGHLPNPRGQTHLDPPFAKDPACAPDGSKYYALLISGGIDKDHNPIRYYNDIAYLYKTLNKTYGLSKDHIKVVMSDGSSSTDNLVASYNTANNPPTANYGKSAADLDGDGNPETWSIATKDNVKSAIAGFSDLKSDDNLFIFTTSHGAVSSPNTNPDPTGKPNNNDVDLYLWGNEKISDKEFATALDGLTNNPKISMTMEQCNGGGFINDVIPTSGSKTRVLATAARGDEPSKSNDFSYFWIAGVAGKDTIGNPADADADKNNRVSMKEAYDYGFAHDPSASALVEHPNLANWTADSATSQFFSACAATQSSITVTLPLTTPTNTWNKGSTYKVTWDTSADFPSPATTYVKIQLMKEPGIWQADLSSTAKFANTGKTTGVSWQLTSPLPGGPNGIGGSDYYVQISTNGLDRNIVGKSAYLTLTGVTQSTPTTLTVKSLPFPGTGGALIDITDSVGKALYTPPKVIDSSTGSYVFNPISAGKYSISLSQQCYYRMITPVTQTIISGTPASKTITLDPVPQGKCDNGAYERGSIQIGSLPDEGYHVWIAPATDHPVFVDRGETPWLTEIGPGQYLVKVTADGYVDSDPVLVTVAAGGSPYLFFVLKPLPPVINGIVVYGSPYRANTVPGAPVSATVKGSNLGDLTGVWNWDDGQISDPMYVVNGQISATHKYAEAGLYTVRLTVTDSNGKTDTKDALTPIAVYDPEAGFVIGAGSIDSPAGAYVDSKSPQMTGKAYFGFVSKYIRGKSVPQGVTEFYFDTPKMNFLSIKNDVLMVNGANAIYTGTGKISGRTGDFKFVVSTVDGAVPKQSSDRFDRFRIRITDMNGVKVYDNMVPDNGQPDPANDADLTTTPTTKIKTGFITIQSK